MAKYLLHTTYITEDGSYYPARITPYDESDLPATLLQKPKFWTIVTEEYVAPKDNNAFTPSMVTETKKHTASTKDTVTVKKVDMYFKPNAETLADSNDELIQSTEVVDLFNNPDTRLSPDKVNIHTATVEELDSLPFVSLKTARKIVDLRDNGVVLSSADDLAANVNKGIDWVSLPLDYVKPEPIITVEAQ